MGFISKLLGIPTFVQGAYDPAKDNTNTIVFDIDKKEIYFDGFVFVCHNNDEEEDIMLSELDSKLDDYKAMCEGQNEQIEELRKAIEQNTENDDKHNVCINNNTAEIDALKMRFDDLVEQYKKLSGILVDNNKSIEELTNWYKDWKTKREKYGPKKQVLND